MLSRMVKQASKARATLLAVGVQAVSELDDHVGPESSPLAIKYRHSGVTSQGPSQLGSSSHSHSHINSNGNGNGNSSSGEGDLVAPTEDDPSVHILHSTNTDVQPELLLSDARLKEIRDGPLMKNSAHLAQLRDLEEHLHAFKQEDALIPAQEIPALMNKLNVLYGRHVVEVTLQLQPKGKKAFQEAGFKRIEKRFDTLERRREAIDAAIDDGNMERALQLAHSALLACERLEQHLNRVLREIKYEERIKTAHAQVALAGAAAGGIIVIGISLSFFGYLPAGIASAQAMEAVLTLAATGTVVCLGAASLAFLLSNSARSYLDKLRHMTTLAKSFRDEFLDLKDVAHFDLRS